MGGKLTGYGSTSSYRYNSGYNYVEEDDRQKTKKTPVRFMGGRFTGNQKPVSYRYNSGFNYTEEHC